MKILFLTRLYWPHVGGVERHVEEVSVRVSGKVKKVTILTTRYDDNLKWKEKRKGIEIIRFRQPRIKYLGLLYTWFWMLKNIDLINKSDIIHVHDVFIWYLPFRFLFPRKPVYTTFHGWEGKYPLPLKSILQKKLAAKLSSKTIAVGEYIGKHYGIKPNLVTYGGINESKFRPKDSQPLADKYKMNKNSIVYVGRLEEDTGLPIFLNSLEHYRRTDDRSKINIEFLGDGSLTEECEKFGKVYGFVDTAPYFAKASICLASGYLTILEAFANKCLVITAYDNPLKKDYYQLTPFKKWIISSNSPAKIAETIADYFKNKSKYQSMINAGYNWVKTQTWEKLAQNYLQLWEI